MRYKKLALSGLLLLGLTAGYSQGMKVQEKTGKETVYDLQNMKKMTFSLGNLHVTEKGKSDVVYSLNALRKLDFSKVITAVEKGLLSEEVLKIYPNPVQNTVHIAVGEKGLLNILTMEGKIVFSQEVESGVFSMDMNGFGTGIYICQYNNGTVIKTERIIK